ncbi:pyridoxamine 5'-phosphate oxidase family protein [Almyronema epifaneia]|uniref:Pyridoxamine 5'-phosphate oxidase family protein n=1 Tax=Almyronema epifaneia S1 TaxID=2991925 RepID=A0ABW6I949_9CYAN
MSQSPSRLQPTVRTQLKRLPKRGRYETEQIYQILDEALVCHVGFAVEGQPYVIPTAFGRIGDRLYLHGSPASRLLRSLQAGIEVCVTVTLLDGLVLARSAFHHSMNYRSVVVFGTATVVEPIAEKVIALKAFTDQVVPGRWDELRSPTEAELNGTLVLSIPLSEASAKVRSGPPIDDPADYALPIWAGEIPLRLTAQSPIADPQLATASVIPDSVQNYQRG